MSVGFNPEETLLSAAGACMTSSLGLVAKNSGVEIGGARIHAVGTRQDDPPRLITVTIEWKRAVDRGTSGGWPRSQWRQVASSTSG